MKESFILILSIIKWLNPKRIVLQLWIFKTVIFEDVVFIKIENVVVIKLELFIVGILMV